MMTYYEEFGVRNDASVEEIRQAYKTLVRLLHPDGQVEEKLRLAAACQMKRLHEVLDILVDPRKRRAYDETLAAGAASQIGGRWTPPMRPEPPFVQEGPLLDAEAPLAHSALRYWFWILIALVLLGSGFWYGAARIPALAYAPQTLLSTIEQPDQTAVAPPAPAIHGETVQPDMMAPPALHEAVNPDPIKVPKKPVLSAKSPVRPLDRAPEPELPLSPGQVAAGSTANNMAMSLPAPAPSLTEAKPEIHQPAFTPPAAGESAFAGNWFYLPSLEKPDPHLYPAIYIELRLAEENGVLSGNYRAQYSVPDKAISQNVVFQAQGQSSAGSSATLVWTSEDGAKGEITLALRSANLMAVTWWTTKLGRRPRLGSGAALLLRQQAQ